MIEFAEHGYSGAKVVEIVRRAGANIAAINYHFGGKDELFRQVLRHSFALADAKYPLQVAEGTPPREALASFIRAFIKRSLDRGEAGYFNAIMCKSVRADDTPFALVFEEVERLELRYLQGVLNRLLDSPDEETLRLATVNVIHQSLVLAMNPRMRRHVFPDPPGPAAVERFVSRQIEGTLAFLSTFHPVQA
jgi:AcrR family transcriptional regulator